MDKTKQGSSNVVGLKPDVSLPFMFKFFEPVRMDMTTGLGFGTEYSTSSAGRESGWDEDP